jgi:O-acetyl-ADP-ribose deacetylase (regulator of RNase III)
MPIKFALMQQGVTNLSAEVLANGTNLAFIGKDGVCQKAGSVVQSACQQFLAKATNLKIGDTFLTPAGALSAKHIVHVISPIWGEQAESESLRLLELCYTNVLEGCMEHGFKIIAFPTISTGLEGFPKKTAADCALNAVKNFVQMHPDAFQSIWFVCAETAEYKIYEKRWEDFLKAQA